VVATSASASVSLSFVDIVVGGGGTDSRNMLRTEKKHGADWTELNGLGERAGAESTIRHQCKNSTKAMMKKSETIYFWGANRTHRYSPEQPHSHRCRGDAASTGRQTKRALTPMRRFKTQRQQSPVCVCVRQWVAVGVSGRCGCGPALLKAAAGRHTHTHSQAVTSKKSSGRSSSSANN